MPTITVAVTSYHETDSRFYYQSSQLYPACLRHFKQASARSTLTGALGDLITLGTSPEPSVVEVIFMRDGRYITAVHVHSRDVCGIDPRRPGSSLGELPLPHSCPITTTVTQVTQD